jgi:hypothetical protein
MKNRDCPQVLPQARPIETHVFRHPKTESLDNPAHMRYSIENIIYMLNKYS